MMIALDRDPAIHRMAHELGLGSPGRPVEAIISRCVDTLADWSKAAGGVSSLGELFRLACARLHVVFHEVANDLELDRLIREYVAAGEGVFATLKCDLDDETYGALLERHQVGGAAPDRYVAVIDCRGRKSWRRYFTRWHEIAHLLTMTRQLELPYHRSRLTARDPIERLMDAIAGEIGFYEPIVRPAVAAEVTRSGGVTFAGVERIRTAVCPDASFRATLNTCVSRCPLPAILAEIGLGLAAAEQRTVDSGQMFLSTATLPAPLLRVKAAFPNAAAREARFRVDWNMRVPEGSAVWRHFYAEDGIESLGDSADVESFDLWRHADGAAVGEGLVWVQGRRIEDSLLAIFQPGPTRR